MNIVSIYASILALLFVALSVRIIRLRQKLNLSLGDAGNTELIKAIRAQSNFAEYAPLALLLLFFLENANGSALLIHGLCLLLLMGRSIHAYGISQLNENISFRVVGMMMTFSTIVITSLAILTLHILPI